MKNWLWLLVPVILLLTAGITAPYWLAYVWDFAGKKSANIQGLAGLIQISSCIIAVLGFFIGLAFRKKKTAKDTSEYKGQVKKTVETQEIVIRHKKPASAKALRAAYLNHIFNTTRPLSLAGVDPKAASEAEARLDLEAVYTALLTQSTEAHAQWQRGKMPEKESRRLSALEQLNRHPRLVLLGDPGSGKSTFVNFVALCMAGEALERKDVNLSLLTTPLPGKDAAEDKKQEKSQEWDHAALIPIRIILRDFAARALPDIGVKAAAKDVWNFIAAELKSATLGDYADHLHKELLQRGGLLLVDGLDEVPEANQRRTQIKQAVEDFAAAFPRCRILVTSRTYAYQQQDWRLPNFTETVLAPFGKAQIQRFVERWYAHIGMLRGMDQENARGRAELLKRAISNNDRLMALAERPLLLTLMASLHAWRGGSLPEQREQLYADTVDLLLDWWESPKTVRDAKGQVKMLQPSLAEWLKVDRQKVRALLNEQAFQAHVSQPDLLGTADVPEKELVAGLMELSRNPDVKPGRLIEYLSQRAGLLLPRGLGVYTFPHRTFQEYLAACYLTDFDYPECLAELLRKDPNRWREVALLAGAKAARGAASTIWQLADALCYQEPESGKVNLPETWAAHLAGQALAETADLSKVSPRNKMKLERVKRWLVSIIRREEFPAIERAAAGVSLAQLGDPRPEVMTLDKMQFCWVPAGPFWMGSDEYENEKPAYQNELIDYDYFISRFPITNAQFNEFVQDSGYAEPKFWPEAKAAGVWNSGKMKGYLGTKPRVQPANFGIPFNLPNHPVVFVNWYEALAFTRWLSLKWKQKGWIGKKEKIALPSEAEWEKAARGGLKIPAKFSIITIENKLTPANPGQRDNQNTKRRYPWGDEPESNHANYDDTGIGHTSAVGCFSGGVSPYGCEELSGNVWEWTRSLWGKDWKKADFNYPYKASDGRENLDAPKDIARVLRGGPCYVDHRHVRCAYRLRSSPDSRYNDVGFRVVVSPFL